MFFRLFSFVLSQMVWALAGYFLTFRDSPTTGILLGCIAGGLFWVVWDFTRGIRVLEWLRRGDTSLVAVSSGLWGEVADRTRRLIKLKNQKIQESDTRLQLFLSALQASPNGVVLIDASGRIEWFNQMASSHFGFEAKRDLLQHFGNLVRDPTFAAYYTEGNFNSGVIMPGRENSAIHPVRLSVHVHPYGDGRSLLLSSDVTALEQAEAMRRDFVANVSHEIRTPLTVLSGFVETLQTLPLSEAERSKYLDLMAQQALRMQNLVSDLLTLSRLDGSPLPGNTEWVSMRVVMRQLEQEAQALSNMLDLPMPDNQQLIFEVTPDIEISGSPSEILSAMSNLVSNAIRYTPSDGSIHVRLRIRDEGRVEFSVQDSGPGIAPEHIPRLTERFYRVDRSRSRDTGGTGLGLAIVKHVVQRHGAELKIDSATGHGSTFSIIFSPERVRIKPAAAVLPDMTVNA